MTDPQQQRLIVVRIDRGAPAQAVAQLLDEVLEGVSDVHVVRGTRVPYTDDLLDVHLGARTRQWHTPLRTPAFHDAGIQFGPIADEDLNLRYPWTLFAAPSGALDRFLGACMPSMFRDGLAEHGPVTLARVRFDQRRPVIVPEKHWRWNDEDGWVEVVIDSA